VDPEFCLADGCGEGLVGQCTYKPASCDDDLAAGVCGCDGETYFNTCDAHQAGIAVAGEGACELEAVICQVAEGFGPGEGCAQGEYCMGGCSGEGVCAPEPVACDDLSEGVVCACNGATFASPCNAALQGVNVESAGACEGGGSGSGDACGGIAGLLCPTDEHCDTQACGADIMGACVAIWTGFGQPGLFCLPSGPQECGCDGVTYSNKCARILAGAAKDYDGACGESVCALGGEVACGIGLYCAGPLGSCEGEGICEPTSLVCLESGPAVCGCDGVTYTSACHAHQQDAPMGAIGACG
jgi:hypothetical protein